MNGKVSKEKYSPSFYFHLIFILKAAVLDKNYQILENSVILRDCTCEFKESA